MPFKAASIDWINATSADPGILVRVGGGPGPSARNSSDIVFFSPQLILQIYSGLSMVNFKENYTFRVQHFPGALTEKLSLCEYLTKML